MWTVQGINVETKLRLQFLRSTVGGWLICPYICPLEFDTKQKDREGNILSRRVICGRQKVLKIKTDYRQMVVNKKGKFSVNRL